MAHLREKIIVIVCGVLFSVIILESGIRLGGVIFSSLQEHKNFTSIKRSGSYRIMCLGDSTTAGQYPPFLEEALKHRSLGIIFSVIDKGVTGSNTAALLSNLEENLNKYHPDMVITMMGYNDRYILYYKDIRDAQTNTGLFRHSSLYRFARLAYTNILKRLQGKDYYRPDRDSPEAETIETVNANKLVKYERVLKKVIELNPQNYWAYIGLSWIYQMEGRLSKAEELYKKAIELNPDNRRAYDKIYQADTEFFSLEALLKKIIELNPGDDGAYAGLGFIYRLEGKLSKAEELCKKALKLNPKNDLACLGLGWGYRQEGKLPEAGKLLLRAIELNPKNDWAYILLGEVYTYFKKPPDIVEGLFRKAVELNPKEDTWAYTRLGYFLFETRGKLLEAEKPFKQAIEVKPGSEGGYIGLGLDYQKQGRFLEAEQLFKGSVELNPKNDVAYRALESLYKEMKKKGLAEEYSRKASKLELNEYSPPAAANYRKLKQILDKRGIKLACMQYPMRSVESLKKIFIGQNGIIFIDNEKIFKEAVARGTYWDYFVDMFAGNFGHCTAKGNRLLAENIANVIIKEYSSKIGGNRE